MEEIKISGIIGVVKQNYGGVMLVEGDYYVCGKTLQKVALDGKLFSVKKGGKYVDVFVDDQVLITKNDIINLTARQKVTDLSSLFDEISLANFNVGCAQLSFYGVVERINFFKDITAARIMVSKLQREAKEHVGKCILIVNRNFEGELYGAYHRSFVNLAEFLCREEREITLSKVFNHYRTQSVIVVDGGRKTAIPVDAFNFVKRNC